MKTPSFQNVLAAAAFGALTLAPQAALHAQDAVKTTTTVDADGTTSTSTATTNTAGTIQEFTPGASRIIVRTSAGAPVTYSYSKKTTFVDAAGNVVDYTTIKSGEPTTVYYTTVDGQPVVSKVVVQRTAPAAVTKTETSETTTTTTSGRH